MKKRAASLTLLYLAPFFQPVKDNGSKCNGKGLDEEKMLGKGHVNLREQLIFCSVVTSKKEMLSVV